MLTNPVTKATLFLSNQYLLLCPWDTLIFAAYNRQRNAGTTPAHKKTSSPKTEPEKLRQQNAPRHNSVFFDEVIAYYILNQQYTLTQNLYAIIISTDFCIIIYSEGELQVHTKPETLGKIIKSARQRSELTMEELAERIGITERYLYRIENEGKKPSYDILYKLIRELSISPDLIFYPEKPSKESEVENLIRMLYTCDERSLEVVKATAKFSLCYRLCFS